MCGPLTVAVIVGSTRPGRQGDLIARWCAREAGMSSVGEVDLVDLVDHALSGRLGEGRDDPRALRLATRLDRADAFLVVTPEYNHSFPASLKQAIDWHVHEWAAKPVGFVSYGGRSGGLRAVEALRLVFAELNAVTVRETVSLHMPWNEDREGLPSDEAADRSLARLLHQLMWWARALKNARTAEPFEAMLR